LRGGRVDDEEALAGLVLVDGDVVALELGVGGGPWQVLEVLEQAGLAGAREGRVVGDARARRGAVVEHALLEREGGAHADPAGPAARAEGHEGLVAGGDVEDVPLEPALFEGLVRREDGEPVPVAQPVGGELGLGVPAGKIRGLGWLFKLGRGGLGIHMFDVGYYSREAVFQRVRAEAMRIHGDKFEDGHKLERLVGGFAVVRSDKSFSVAATGRDSRQHHVTFRVVEGKESITMLIPKTLVAKSSLAPHPLIPGKFLWHLWEKVILLVLDDMKDDHITLHFKDFDQYIEHLMVDVMGQVTEKFGPAIVIDA